MYHSKRDIQKIKKKINENKKAKKADWYENLTFEEIKAYYQFARVGYITKSSQRFNYSDCQGVKYIRVKLLLKYLSLLTEKEGLEKARAEYQNLFVCGFTKFSTLKNEKVICTEDARITLISLNQGVLLENHKFL